MKINFVDLARQNKRYQDDYLKIVSNLIKTATFVGGFPVEQFENNFAQFTGKKYCIGVNSGTDALFFALLAYGVGPGDEVITAPNSYFSSAMVISLTGAAPVFADVNPNTLTIDPIKIAQKITSKTRAIIPVHLCGQPADLDEIISIAQKNKLFIIEDCCQAHGALYNGKKVPITETGAFSFYPGKNLGSFGDGGALVTNNKIIAEKVRLLRNDGSREKYKHELFGYKSRLDTLQAAILSYKLTHLTHWNSKRRAHAQLYRKLLSKIPQIQTPEEAGYAYHVYHLYIIETPRRNELQDFLAKKDITTVIHYPTPIHLQKPYRQLGYKPGDFPITEEKAKRILSLPMFPELTEKEIRYIVTAIRDFTAKSFHILKQT